MNNANTLNTMTDSEYIRLKAQTAVLEEIAIEYSGKTIDNIIKQLKAITQEYEQS